jgi:ubiquinol-cytochrome c reductase subunit 7
MTASSVCAALSRYTRCRHEDPDPLLNSAVLRVPPASAEERVDQAGRGEHHELGCTRGILTKQDSPYLSNIIEEIESEMKEREDLEALIVSKRAANAKSAGH